MERSKIEHEGGFVILVVAGPAGAVTLDAAMADGKPWGVLGLHRVPGDDWAEEPAPCTYVEGGLCLGDVGYNAGQKLAPLALSDEEAAYAELESWYRERIEEER